MTTRMVMEEKTKIGATKSKKSGWRLLRWIIGLFLPNSLFCMGRSMGIRGFPPTDTHLSIVFSPPPPSSPLPFPLHHIFMYLCISCEYLLFDYLLCATKEAAAVTPESHQTLASLSGTLSRLSPTVSVGWNLYFNYLHTFHFTVNMR